MIALLQGKVIYLSAPMAIITTASGVGYEVELSIPTFCQLQLNQEVSIWIHHHIREDASLLYGFSTHSDRAVFQQLIKINGVGAKVALAILSNLSTIMLKQCIIHNDDAPLIRIPGIGKKTAQRLLIELEDKLKNITLLDHEETTSNTKDMQAQEKITSETKAALISLGYTEKESEKTIQHLRKQENTVFETTQSLIKASLKQLAK